MTNSLMISVFTCVPCILFATNTHWKANPFHRHALYNSVVSVEACGFHTPKNNRIAELLRLEVTSGGHLAQPPLCCVLQALEVVACQGFKGAQVYVLPPVCLHSLLYVSLGAGLSPF